jgi:hypothetical protein
MNYSDTKKLYCKWKNGKKEGVLNVVNYPKNSSPSIVFDPVELLEFAGTFIVDSDGTVEKKDDFILTLFEVFFLHSRTFLINF